MTEKKKSGTGLDKNTAGALSYVIPVLSGVVFLILEKDPFVRFHAMQNIVLFTVLTVLQVLFTATIFLIPLASLIWLLGFVLWLLLIYKAWKGEEWEVPVLGKYARKFVAKLK
ncbi:hypothetical protein JXA63_01580 [Candidatus Woesebacteria bacterium]|nr:hypothetical protein [Candidatus Woesebacteria bacterium]